MRIKILQTPRGDVDGIHLDCFRSGQQYELTTVLAALLLAEGWAEPVPLDEPHPYIPFSEDDPFDCCVLYDEPPNLVRENYPPYLNRDMAADFTFRRRPRKR